MEPIIEKILLSVRHNISNGYYSVNSDEIPSKISLKKQIELCKANPVIAEMKFSSLEVFFANHPFQTSLLQYHNLL